MAGRRGKAKARRSGAKVLGFALAFLVFLAALWVGVGHPRPEPGGTQPASGGDLPAPSFADLLATPAGAELPGRLVVYFLDTGQSDATYIRTPDGKVVLVDTGDEPEDVVGFLREKGVDRVDVMVLTHPHADHIGGALAVLDGFEVGKLYDSGFPHTSEQYAAVLAKAVDLERAGRLVRRAVRAGDTLDFGAEVTATVLHPAEPLGEAANDASVVIRVVFGSFSLLLTGDVEAAGEAAILGRGAEVEATVLKVAHHGSHTSSGAEFLAAASPAAAVIEVGAGNDYGHPSRDVLDRLEAAGARVYRTDRDGTIIVHSDGSIWGIVTGAGTGAGDG